jgi:hypothetical protein
MSSATSAAPSSAAAGAVTFEIDDEGVSAPTEVPSGLVAVTFANTSDEPHALLVSAGDILHGAFLAPGAETHGIVSYVAGSTYTVQDQFGPSSNRAQFTAADHAGAAAEPDVEISVGMEEFAYSMPDTASPGQQWWELTNSGEQLHDLGIYSLADATRDEVLADLEAVDAVTQSPPEVTEIPVWVVGSGQTIWVQVDLAAGPYLVVCRVPDTSSGLGPDHWHNGMLRDLTVGD